MVSRLVAIAGLALWTIAIPVVIGPPGAPGAPAAIAGEASATVYWSAASGAVSTYAVTASPGGANATVGGSTLSAVVGGLSDGTSYSFTVTASNGSGPGLGRFKRRGRRPRRISGAGPGANSRHASHCGNAGSRFQSQRPGPGAGGRAGERGQRRDAERNRDRHHGAKLLDRLAGRTTPAPGLQPELDGWQNGAQRGRGGGRCGWSDQSLQRIWHGRRGHRHGGLRRRPNGLATGRRTLQPGSAQSRAGHAPRHWRAGCAGLRRPDDLREDRSE